MNDRGEPSYIGQLPRMDGSSVASVPGQSDEGRCAQLLRQAGIDRLRASTSGDPNVFIALLDGPVDCQHPCLKSARIFEIAGQLDVESGFAATAHATSLASMLVGRGGRVPSLCPDCTLLSFPIVDKAFQTGSLSPTVAAERISAAIVQAVASGASVIQLSLEFSPEGGQQFRHVGDALRYAAIRSVNTVIAAGNRPTLGSASVLTAPGAVPVGMAGLDGMPHPSGALGISIGTRGLLASGVDIPVAVPPDRYDRHAGSSYAASFVTGTYSLLRSCNRNKGSDEIWEALLRPNGGLARPHSIVPPLLNGDRALDRIRRPSFEVQSKGVLRF